MPTGIRHWLPDGPGHVLITARPIQARCRTSDLGQGRHAPQYDHVPGKAAELLERHRWSSGSEERSAVRPAARGSAREAAGGLTRRWLQCRVNAAAQLFRRIRRLSSGITAVRVIIARLTTDAYLSISRTMSTAR